VLGKRRIELVIVLVLVILIEKPQETEDEPEDDNEPGCLRGFSKHALMLCV
jgi:hypothetical protein